MDKIDRLKSLFRVENENYFLTFLKEGGYISSEAFKNIQENLYLKFARSPYRLLNVSLVELDYFRNNIDFSVDLKKKKILVSLAIPIFENGSFNHSQVIYFDINLD